MAENTIDNLSIQVTASAENAARVFDRLASSAGRLRGAASGAAGGMQDMAQGARDAGTATATAGTQAGRAEPRIRSTGKAAKEAGDNAKKGASGVKTFWESLKRIAFYRFIRSIIKEITAAFGEGIKNLYHWSDAVNGHFAASMDRLATSSLYLKNSLGAMVSPLIETLVPVLDVIIDKVVDVLNFFNMLVSAVSGADTYTVAKKAAAVWDDSSKKTRGAAKKAADDIKRTILGFDEINKLVKPNSSSGSGGSSSTNKQPNYAEMFEEKPLTGIFKKISDITSGWPDWLKALLGVGTAGLAIFGIPALLKTIWDWLKKLFSINIPDWFRWLFGPKGNGNGNGIDLPDNIKLPDADVKVNLDTDDIEEVKVPVSTTPTGDELFKDLRHDWNKNKTTLFMNDKLLDSGDELFKKFRQEWNKNKTTLFVSVLLLKTGEELFKALRSLWNKDKTTLFVDVRLLKTGDELFNDFRAEWNTAKTTLFVNDKLLDSADELFKEFRGEWNKVKTTLFVNDKLLDSADELFKEFRHEWNTIKTTLFVSVVLIKKDWTTIDDYISDNFGGATGGGGSSRGGGAGRKYPVQVTLDSPTSNDTLSLWDRIKQAWDASVIAADKSLDVFVRPAIKKTGEVLNSVGGKLIDWLFPSASAEESRAWEVAVNFAAANNPKYKNSTLGNYLVDAMKKVKPEVTTKVKSVAGALSKIVQGKIVPDVGDTSSVNTVVANPGTAMEWSRNTVSAIVGNTMTTNTVNAVAGYGMSGTNSYTLSANVADTDSTNTVYLDKGWYGSPTGALGLDNLSTDVDVGIKKGWWGSVTQALNLDNLKTTISVVAKVATKSISLAAAGGGKWTLQTKALGGIFANGLWSSIPQYAGGTAGVNHGSLFWAGERGAEIVGNAGGRTEVLNKSQIASAMYSAVQAAMAPAAANFAEAAANMGVAETGFDFETLADMVRQGVEQAMSRSNDYDRQKVELLRSINDKDFNVDVSTASINKAQSRMNRRAGVTIAPVGT